MIILPISDVGFETKLLTAALDISKIMYILALNVFFRQIKSFIRFRLAFVFELQTL